MFHLADAGRLITVSITERRDLMHCCSVTQLQSKEVISTQNGCRIGFVSDVEIDLHDGKQCAILVDMRRKGGTLSAKNVDKAIMEVLEVTGFTRLFKFI